MTIQLFDEFDVLVGTFGSIQAAVDAADLGATIEISAGTYLENVVLGEGISLVGTGAVTIDGGASGPAIAISGGGAGQSVVIDNIDLTGSGTEVILIDSAATYDSVTVQNGSVTGGDYHGLFVDEAAGVGAIALNDMVFSGNATVESGGSGEAAIDFYKFNGDVSLSNVSVENPGAAAENGIQFRGGDTLASMGSVSLDGVSISGSYAKTGMAIYNYSDAYGLNIGAGGLDINVTAGWLGLNVDNVGGFLNLSAGNINIENNLAGAGNDIALQGLNGGGSETFFGDASDDTLIGKGGYDTLHGRGGDDILVGGAGGDTLLGEAGDDTILWSVGDGRDYVNGGSEIVAGDSFVLTGDGTDEAFDIYADAFLADPGNAAIAAALGYTPGNAEVVVARDGVVVAELTDIENIVIDGVSGNDTYTVHGDIGGVIVSTPQTNNAPVAVDDVVVGPQSEFLVNEFTNAVQERPAVTTLSNGNFVVTWESDDQQQGDADSSAIKARIFDINGIEIVTEFIVNEYTAGGQERPSITALSNGGFIVVWESYDQQQGDTDESALKARIFDSSGIEIVSEFLVNEFTDNSQVYSSVTALSGGGFAVTWHSHDHQQGDTSAAAVKVRIFDANGVEVVSEFVANEYTNGGQGNPVITELSGGSLVVAWSSSDQQQSDTDNNAIKARIFDVNGVEVVSEFVVNEFTSGGQFSPSIIALSSGGFVVTWVSNDQQQGDVDDFAIKARIFDANGVETVSEFLVNEFTSGSQTTSAITALTNGGFVVTWRSNDQGQDDTDGPAIKARIFDANGVEVVSEFVVNEFTNGAQTAPVITALSDGGFVVTWQSNDGQQGDTDGDSIKARIFDANGVAQDVGGLPEDSVTLIDTATLLANDTDADMDTLSVTAVSATSTEGATVTLNVDDTISYDPASSASLQALAEGQTLQDTFTYTISDGHGGEDTATVTVTIVGANDAPVVVGVLPDSAVDELGAISIATSYGFLDVDTGDVPTFSATLSDDSPLPAWLTIDPVTGELSGTAPSVGVSGEALSIKVTVVDGAGLSVSSGFMLNIDNVNNAPIAVDDVNAGAGVSEFQVNEFTIGEQSDPSITTLSNGNLVVTWRSNDGQQGDDNLAAVKARIFDANGTEIVSEFLVNEFTLHNQLYSSVAALSNGGFVVTWHSSIGQQGDPDVAIKARIFDANGNETVDEFLVNEFVDGAQSSPSITALSNGGFIVTWYSQDDQQGDADGPGIKARIFDAGGIEVVSEFLVNEYTVGAQYEPSITALSNGGFVVAWETLGLQQGDTSLAAIKARIFDANGTEVVSEFLVNEYTNSNQKYPSITALSNGGFVVAWDSLDGQQGDTGAAIKARIFDASGTETVSEFLVNEYTVGNQSIPSVTALSSGGFIVTWQSNDQQQGDTGVAIKARIFDASGTEVVSEFLVNEFTDGYQYYPSVSALPNGGFVVTWQSLDAQQGDTDGWAIKARIFDANGVAQDVGVPESSVTLIDTATLLANDSDADMDTLSVTAVSATSAEGATLTLNMDGTISYDPSSSASAQALAQSQTLQDTFTYTTSDGNGGQDTATVTVTVVGTDAVINGTSGVDILIGLDGDDMLIGAAGDDVLSGGAGDDTFIFNPGFGHDTITDFVAGAGSDDAIEFDQSVFADFAAVSAAAAQVGADVVITFDGSNTLTLEDVVLATLHADDFQFIA